MGFVVSVSMTGAIHSHDYFLELKKANQAQQWRGSVGKTSTENSFSTVVTEKSELVRIWTTWKIKGVSPNVDFENNFVLVEMGRGIPVISRFELTKDGHLSVAYVQKPVWSPQLNYLITSVPSRKVKSVNGRNLERK